MARILVPQEPAWYDELNTVAYYLESEFETRILKQAKEVFSDYYVCKLKVDFNYSGLVKIPDLGFIRKDYKEWWVVEVELGDHPFSHVEEQVDVFLNGNCNSILVRDKFLENIKDFYELELSPTKTLNLIKKNSPKVLVIVDEINNTWQKKLKKMGAQTCYFEVYKNTNGFEAFRLHGEYPKVLSKESHCRFHKSIKNLLEINNPNILTALDDEVNLSYNEKLTNWKKIEEDGKVYLRSVSDSISLPEFKSYVLYSDNKDNLYIKGN